MSLSFSLENSNLSILEEDDNILLTEMYVVSTGDSRPVMIGKKAGITNFSLDSIEKASKTLCNKPIVCIWNVSDNDFKNHAYTTQDKADRIAIGVIPESCDMRYEEVDDKTFLVCKVAFWKKYFPEMIDKIANNTKENKPTNLSMEISILDATLEDDNKHYLVNDFKFEGVSLLGENVLTGIEGARMDTIKFSSVENLDNIIHETNVMFSKNNQKGDIKLELTNNQIREILDSAIYEYRKENDIYGWLMDFDSDYAYVYINDDKYKLKYDLDKETNKATLDFNSKVKVINGGWIEVKDGETPKTYTELEASCKELESKFESIEKEKSELEASKTELETKVAEFSKIEEEKVALETKFSEVNKELTELKEESVTKFSRLVELEGMFSKQVEEQKLQKVDELLASKSAYFSSEEIESMKKDFKENFMDKENGFVTFSTVVCAKVEPLLQAKLEELQAQLKKGNLSEGSNVEFSSSPLVDNSKREEEPQDAWSRVGYKKHN